MTTLAGRPHRPVPGGGGPERGHRPEHDVGPERPAELDGDHGYDGPINTRRYQNLADSSSFDAADLLFYGSAFSGADNFKAAGTYNATLLFKDFGSRGALQVSDAPASLLDIAATVCDAIGGCAAELEGASLRRPLPASPHAAVLAVFRDVTRSDEG